jgi:hypothetical protein
MKVLFAGSSLYGSNVDLSGIEVRPPARQGDFLRAVRDGADAIGLIDGEFLQSAAVWHKEILFALSRGVIVFGASSMGALRAAECAAFGMRPIGVIANRYLDGSLDDDAAVALVMTSTAEGSAPVTEPLVDAEATLSRLLDLRIIDQEQFDRSTVRAQSVHFSIRTALSIFEGEPDPAQLVDAYRRHHASQKRLDAEMLVAALRSCSAMDDTFRPDFVLAESPYWVSAFAEVRASAR